MISSLLKFFRLCPLLIMSAGLYLTCSGDWPHSHGAYKNYQRIISFAPSITETLFALSCGKNVVGVTAFCTYPAQVRHLPKVGGYIDPNFEMIIRLKPDLVIMLKEHEQLKDFLKLNGIDYLLVDNHNLEAIIGSILQIGTVCGKPKQADSLVSQIKNECIQHVTKQDNPPRVFLCADRDVRGSGAISRVFAAGKSTFYSDLLEATGLQNALRSENLEYPQLSAEGIMQLQPDIIIDLSMRTGSPVLDGGIKDWAALADIPAIKNNMVFCLNGDFMTIPGPRVFLILKEFKKINYLYRSAMRKE